ncbi:hypothetical protein WJX74_007820 [Apatococcus lobatus]|uniref:PsbP C-terminal domain-containing protein n=2 Tax=Apatococcus TaxID=904362 RepID=A0AAW1SM25_9CHLO
MLALLPAPCPGNQLLSGSDCGFHESFGSFAKKRQRSQRSGAANALKTHKLSDSEEQEPAAQSRRQIMLQSWNYAVLGTAISGSNDATTIVNSILGAYGLPKLKGSNGFRVYDDLDNEWVFEFPRSWVARSNHQRQGVYVSDFNTADKATLEIFKAGDEGSPPDLAQEIVRRAVIPAAEVGGDSRLQMPPPNRIQTEQLEHANQAYTYVSFPSETTTRSGYQIRRKNFGVGAERNGTIYSLVASARSDQYSKDKEATLRHIIESFRLREALELTAS